MFFHMFSYKNSCFSELVYNSSIFFSQVGCIQPFLLNIPWLYGNHNVQGAFVIIFFISRHLLLRSIYSHYHYLAYLTASCSYNCMKIIIRKLPSALTILKKVNAELLGPPPKFQVNVKIQLIMARVSRLSFRFL